MEIDEAESADAIVIKGDGSAVTVSSRHEGAQVRIISANGAIIETGIASAQPFVSRPLQRGVYLVSAATQSGTLRRKVAIE